MLTKIHKLSLSFTKTNIIFAYFAATAVALLFAPSAFAASRTYALACGSTNVIVKGTQVYCHAPSVLTIQGVDTAAASAKAGHPYPNDVPLTILVFDCGNNKPVDLHLGATVNSKSFCEAKIGQAYTPVAPTSIKKDTRSLPNPRPVATSPSVTSYGQNSHGQTTQAGNIVTGSGTSTPTPPASQGLASTPDPAACAADPTIKGCEANASAVCGPDHCDLVAKYINPTINILSIAFGLIAVISIILGGIQYSASAGDPQKVTLAKKRITMTLMAIVAYIFTYAFLQFIVPGGLFHHIAT